jgi:hypothetical protein
MRFSPHLYKRTLSPTITMQCSDWPKYRDWAWTRTADRCDLLRAIARRAEADGRLEAEEDE